MMRKFSVFDLVKSHNEKGSRSHFTDKGAAKLNNGNSLKITEAACRRGCVANRLDLCLGAPY